MSEPVQEPVAAQPVPTPAEAVASGQIPAQAPSAQPPVPSPSPAPADDKSEETDWEAESAKWKSLARKHEKGQLAALGFKSMDEVNALRDAAQKYQETQDAQKSEIQKANERAQTASQELTELKAANARLLAAATHGIPPELIDLLGGGSDEEIAARAELLAERLKATAPAAVQQRPVESLTPGAVPASTAATATPDQWIRSLAGRTP